ncbi:MAG TPA: Uma2 family endonuclease, partial [Rubrobacter sp.]|nr:Uma2 family endonuclease [Rubrobacter sp.]
WGLLRGRPCRAHRGEVVQMTPIGWCHARCVSNLNMLLARFAGDRYVVSVQNPITVDERGEPQPDLALLRELPTGRLPGPGEVVLVVEVIAPAASRKGSG